MNNKYFSGTPSPDLNHLLSQKWLPHDSNIAPSVFMACFPLFPILSLFLLLFASYFFPSFFHKSFKLISHLCHFCPCSTSPCFRFCWSVDVALHLTKSLDTAIRCCTHDSPSLQGFHSKTIIKQGSTSTFLCHPHKPHVLHFYNHPVTSTYQASLSL